MRICWPSLSLSGRDNLKELIIVAIGVVLGLAATASVQSFTDAAEVRSIREALDQEIVGNFAARDLRELMGSCIEKRGRDLLAWLDQQPEGRQPLPLTIGGMGGVSSSMTVWEVAKGSGNAAKMQVSDLLAYAKFYASMESFNQQRTYENEIWTNIADLGARRTLDERESASLRVNISRALRLQQIFHRNHVAITTSRFARIHSRPTLAKPTTLPEAFPICQPLFPD